MTEPARPRSLRLFIAIAIPAPLRASLAPALQRVRALAPNAKAVPEENLHVTLRFLGATPVSALPELEAALTAAADASARFEVRLEGSGSFGAPGRPTLVYAGLGPSADAISELAGRVAAALGLPADERYTPHVSLARARDPRRGDRDLARARDALRDLRAGHFTLGSLALVQSEVSNAGARYRILREARVPA